MYNRTSSVHETNHRIRILFGALFKKIYFVIKNVRTAAANPIIFVRKIVLKSVHYAAIEVYAARVFVAAYDRSPVKKNE